MARKRLTKEQAGAYVARWRPVRAAEIAELRSMSVEMKLRQVPALMASAQALGWRPTTPEEVEAVRERWRLLRQAYDPGP